MTLRRKLLTIFIAVALLSVTVAGTTFWSATTLQELHDELESHYDRSLLLQRIRSAVSASFREHVPAAMMESAESRVRLEFLDAQVQSDLLAWSKRAKEPDHIDSLSLVSGGYSALIAEVRESLAEIDAGRPEKALAWLYRFRSKGALDAFEAMSDGLAEADRAERDLIYSRVEATRSTINVIAVAAVIGTLSLVLLLVAYLASDLFAPLREAERALDALARGDSSVRLAEQRSDEIGKVNRAFNRAVIAMTQQRQHPQNGSSHQGDAHVLGILGLAREVEAIKAELLAPSAAAAEPGSSAAFEFLGERLGNLAHSLTRLAEFGLPLQLTPASTDIRGLLYDILADFREVLARRGVSVDLQIAADVSRAMVDGLRLREAVRELVSNALAALPDAGGTLGLRAAIDPGGMLLLEVADNGRGADMGRLRQAAGGVSGNRLGLWLVREIVERHEGTILLDSAPGEGTHIQLRLPLKPA